MKSNRNGGAAVVEATTQESAPTPQSNTQNFTVRKYHVTPGKERTCYRIPGVPGNLVVFNNLFLDDIAPEELTLTIPLKAPVAKEDKEAEKVRKAQERADKAKERLEAQQAKAQEKARKMQEALEAATKRAAEATAGATS